jgi:hypothetical protein
MKLSHTVGLLTNGYGGGTGVEDQDVSGFDSGASYCCGTLGDRSLSLGILTQATNFGSYALLIGVGGGSTAH